MPTFRRLKTKFCKKGKNKRKSLVSLFAEPTPMQLIRQALGVDQTAEERKGRRNPGKKRSAEEANDGSTVEEQPEQTGATASTKAKRRKLADVRAAAELLVFDVQLVPSRDESIVQHYEALLGEKAIAGIHWFATEPRCGIVRFRTAQLAQQALAAEPPRVNGVPINVRLKTAGSD
eukprot:TRINITY_DN43158_c0_g1_i1.p1 TRINITY_DN43158_c0_g1~~TRINITY_DN43158_c0_g1_i1.p1  ORF type:complete len:191 (-),score=32.34 TRINITY_DN43158_c0_g1_i1:33-560(-)